MVSTFISLLDIQSWWEIPCIAHFCSLFSSAFNLPDIDIEDLESALLTDGTDDTVGLLPELIVCLLKGCDALKNRNEITTSNYQMFLRRFLRQQCRLYNTKNYFDTDIDFQSLPLRNKLLILYSLCHFRLESNNVQTILANLEADSLRVEPLGYDSKNSGYWYFYGTRLYREDTKPGGKTTVWQVICFTEEDWQNLASKFKNSTSPKERALYKILTENFIPKLPHLFRERERLRRRKLLQVRNSARIHNILEEKRRLLAQKQEVEVEIAREKSEEDLKPQAANKSHLRPRRRSQSSSTASGISTYASSIRASTPSSEFFAQHETFCLSPSVVEGEGESNSPKHCSSSNVNDHKRIEEVDSDTSSKVKELVHSVEGERSQSEEEEFERLSSGAISDVASNESDNDNQADHISNYSINSKRHHRKQASLADQELENHQSNSIEFDSKSRFVRSRKNMAPTTNIKLPGRQTNNSLSSIPENIFLSPVFSNASDKKNSKSKSNKPNTEASKSKGKEKAHSANLESAAINQKKKKNKSSEIYTEKDEILQIGMHKVLLYVKNHRDAWPFVDPVDEEIAPRYYSIIRRPMDLLKMEEKLDNEEYKKYSDFRNDFKLIVNNCRLYNGQNNEYTEMVNNLQEAFDKATKKYLDQHSSDEDESFEYPDPRTNVFREKSYNKTTTPKIGEKDLEKDNLKRGKELMVKKNQNEEDEREEENDEKTPENRSNKKKRKEKDKRRKKKSKAKSEQNTVYTDEEEDGASLKGVFHDNSDKEIDSISPSSNKNKRKLNEKFMVKELEPPAKRVKTKSSQKVQEKPDINAIKSCGKKGGDKKRRKLSKSSNKNVSKTMDQESSAEEKEVMDKDSENMPELGCLEKKSVKSRNSSKRKHSPSHVVTIEADKKSVPAQKGSSIDSESNENCKSKNSKLKSERALKEEVEMQIPKISKNRQQKDNKKISNGTNKKRKGRKKRIEQIKPIVTEVKEEEEKVESEADDADCENKSRSSSPLFKIDLHKKYAKSASIKDEDSSCDENKCELKPATNICADKNGQDDDLLSITSQSLSRSASPFNSFESDVAESEKSKSTKSNSNIEGKREINLEEGEKSPNSGLEPSPSSTSFFYLDKYDLIKQRRNRSSEEKWNQIVKEAEKMKDTKKIAMNKTSNSSLSKEKNQKLKETIEKLKVKNAKSKERSVLIDEIFGVKPTQQPRDEKTIFEKLRESCIDAKSPPSAKKSIPPGPGEAKIADARDSIPSKNSPTKQTIDSSEKIVSPSKKNSSKKSSHLNSNNKKTTLASNKTNLEALELETEQTLKDINRWLEHTPRFPEFNSASNSPSRYNLLDDFDAVASKIDPNDFRRPVAISSSKLEAVEIGEIAENKQDVIEDLLPPTPLTTPTATSATTTTNAGTLTTTSLTHSMLKARESSGTTQFLANPPPPPHVKNQQQKEIKRKTLKEKLTSASRRKDILRTIDRLQPGKSKGNLISNAHSSTKTEELFPPAAANKIKEVKNSLVVKTDESGPKLSMGSVLQTEGFGLGQLHNFTDSENIKKPVEPEENVEEQASPEKEVEKKDDLQLPEDTETTKLPKKCEKAAATPNLSAWFKAFGAPKKAKKIEEEEKKTVDDAITPDGGASERCCNEQANSGSSLNIMKSPPMSTETFSLPAPRQRKASTGSTVSERSSFSQDPDSPRVGIDDRFGAFAGPYASPIGASPIMVSPKPDEITKPTSPYPLNGAIKVGFYQDTTTKSSPEKSCSPRELPSPYPQYSQHIYSSASSPTVNAETTNTYGACYNTNSETNKTPVYSSTQSSALFDQYKQPRSQESDYNSMSPNPNSNSPYQQPQNSPYQQHQNSPYQQQNSPYQQSQNSPFPNQSNTSNMLGSSPNSPSISQTAQQPQGESPNSQPNSPYHQQSSSPYQQPVNSPYHQNPTSPYQAPAAQTQQQAQQANLSFLQQQTQSNQSPVENAQRQSSADSSPYRPEPATYSVHESAATGQYPTSNRASLPSYESDIAKQTTGSNVLNKIQQEPEWNTQMDLSAPPTHQSERNPVPISELNAITHNPNQLNTPPLQHSQINQLQNDKATSLQYNYSQFGADSQKEQPKTQDMFGNDLTMDMSMGVPRHQPNLNKNAPQPQQQQGSLKPQQHESNIMNLGGYVDSANRHQKLNQSMSQIPEKQQYDSLQKHQQMFDSFLGSMGSNKNMGFGKSLDIPPSKAFEMFNRAATMGFPKDFSNPLSAGQQKPSNVSTIPNTQMSQQSYHLSSSGAKSMDTSTSSMSQTSNKPLNMVNNYQQQMQHHMNDTASSKMSAFPTPMSTPANDLNKVDQHSSSNVFGAESTKHTQLMPANYSNPDKISNEGIVPPNSRQDQITQLTRSQQLNMDLSNYKTYNNPTAMLDPLRNLNHPLSMIDESLLGLSGSSTPAGYYEKNIPPAAHMFSKNIGPQMYQNPASYAAPTREQQNVGNSYGVSTPNNAGGGQCIENYETKTKRKKKKGSTAVVSSEIPANPSVLLPAQQQQVLQGPNSQSTQGFQLYSDLKTASSGTSATDTSAIALKTASSMVPGSAFNFGPSPPGLGLGPGMYGDNSSYLDPYYLSSGHRTTADASNEKPNNAVTATGSTTPYQFLAHNPVRPPTYHFMNSQLDPNSPIYQQYIQRQEQELRARMMINQGLLGPAAGAAGTAGSYPQPGYRPPTLGMPKHYDMSRQTWF